MQAFKLVPTPEYRQEVERIASQYPGFIRVGIYGFFETGTLIIQAQYHYEGGIKRFKVVAREAGESLQVRAADLLTMFYNELVKFFEIDLIPIDNF